MLNGFVNSPKSIVATSWSAHLLGESGILEIAVYVGDKDDDVMEIHPKVIVASSESPYSVNRKVGK